MPNSSKASAFQDHFEASARVYRFPIQDTRSLRQKAVEALRSSILQGHLLPGQRLLETEIAQQMGISRGPVREALRELEREGLVISEPYRETIVADITLEDVREILVPIRQVLELYAIRLAAPRLTGQDLAQLEGLIAEMRDAGAQGDLHGVVDKDVTFHQTIVQAAGHRVTLQIWESIEHRIRTHFYRNMPFYADLRLVADEHMPLLEALVSKDVERAVSVMGQHLQDALTLSGRVEEPAQADA